MNEADANEASDGGNSVADLQDKIASIRKRKETLEGHRQKLDETGEAQLSLTDPDSRSMHSGTRSWGITPFVPKPDRSPAKSSGQATLRSPSSSTTPQPTPTVLLLASVRCPCIGTAPARPATDLGYQLRQSRGLPVLRSTRPMHQKAPTDESSATRTKPRWRMADRLAAWPEVMDRRRESVEHRFGSIKQWMGQGAFLTRRLNNVRGEFSLAALVYNMRRAINLVGIPAMIAAAAG